jgi:hypothetical protein
LFSASSRMPTSKSSPPAPPPESFRSARLATSDAR